jgi:hypothetical protein
MELCYLVWIFSTFWQRGLWNFLMKIMKEGGLEETEWWLALLSHLT